VIKIPAIEALDNHLSRVSEILQALDSLLIYPVRVVVLRERTVVHIRQLACHLPIIEEVVDVHLIDVPALVQWALVRGGPLGLGGITMLLIQERVEVALLALEAQAHSEVVVVVLLGAFDAIRVERTFHPGVVEHLWDRNPVLRDKLEHALD
jgi:hypothetical protein